MAETVKVDRLKIDFGGSIYNDDALVPASAPMALKVAIALASSTGADAVNKVYFKQLTLAATTANNIDLSGSLTNPLATTTVFTKVRAIIVFLHAGANMGPLLIGGHATAAIPLFTSADTLANDQPAQILRNGASGGLYVVTATDSTGIVVTPTTADILRIYNQGSATCTYDICILGEG